MVKFMKEKTMGYLVERFGEVHNEDVCLFSIFKVEANIICEFYKLGFARSSFSKAMLERVEDVVGFAMFHDVRCNAVF